MKDLINKLQELKVGSEAFLTLTYSEGNEVWHTSDNYVSDSVYETATAGMLAQVLSSGVAVYNRWGGNEPGDDILNDMRAQGALDDYDYEGWFEEYLTEKLQETVYDGEFGLEYTTQQYDYKRGRCDISTEIRVRVGDLIAATESKDYRFMSFDADSFVGAFEVMVETKDGTLTLS